MTRRLEYDAVKQYVEQQGYRLASTTYSNAKTKLHTICPMGHDYWVSFDNFKHGYRCKTCHVLNKTYGIDKIRKDIEASGYKLISKEYKNSHTPLIIECANGHRYYARWNAFQSGHRCPECYNIKRRWQTDEIRRRVEERGYKLISREYVNNIAKLTLECPQGHVYDTTWLSFGVGNHGCSVCRVEGCKVGIDSVKEFVKSQGYRLLTRKYMNAKTKLHLVCPKGHECWITWSDFKTGNRCAQCFKSKSADEQELQQLYKEHNTRENDRQIISPYELDIVFPNHSLAIEYCGLYWHSDGAPGDRIIPSYHRHKLDLCAQKNIRLLTIFSDEWIEHRSICVSRINNALGFIDDRVYARNTNVRGISKACAKEFLNQTHLQGYGRCRVAFGLFYNDELVQVMTFGSPARAHTAKGKRVLEMKRLASKLNTIVVGGASKLFKLGLQYARDNNYDLIKSYCDLRWGTGNLYKQLGFQLTGETKYTPHYTDGKTRWRNQMLATNKKKENTTERRKALKRGLYRIYDCGHQTWEYKLGKE